MPGTFAVYDIPLNTLRPIQNGRHSQTTFSSAFFLNENVWIPLKLSLTFVPKGPINNILTLVQVMAWRRPGDKPFSEPMMVSLSTLICVTRPQWVKLKFYCQPHRIGHGQPLNLKWIGMDGWLAGWIDVWITDFIWFLLMQIKSHNWQM